MDARADAHTTISVLKKGDKNAKYDDFIAELPENECRYGEQHDAPGTAFVGRVD